MVFVFSTTLGYLPKSNHTHLHPNLAIHDLSKPQLNHTRKPLLKEPTQIDWPADICMYNQEPIHSAAEAKMI